LIRCAASIRPALRHLARQNQDQIVGSLAAALTPRTRVVAVTWVHSSTGAKLPIRALADVATGVNANREPAKGEAPQR
jgi:selenocysteine lyase/cysteine desulfurase